MSGYTTRRVAKERLEHANTLYDAEYDNAATHGAGMGCHITAGSGIHDH